MFAPQPCKVFNGHARLFNILQTTRSLGGAVQTRNPCQSSFPVPRTIGVNTHLRRDPMQFNQSLSDGLDTLTIALEVRTCIGNLDFCSRTTRIIEYSSARIFSRNHRNCHVERHFFAPRPGGSYSGSFQCASKPRRGFTRIVIPERCAFSPPVSAVQQKTLADLDIAKTHAHRN